MKVKCKKCGKNVTWSSRGWWHVKSTGQSWFEPHDAQPDLEWGDE